MGINIMTKEEINILIIALGNVSLHLGLTEEEQKLLVKLKEMYELRTN